MFHKLKVCGTLIISTLMKKNNLGFQLKKERIKNTRKKQLNLLGIHTSQ